MLEILIAVGIVALLGTGAGGLLGFISTQFRSRGNPLVEQINQILPQTQCGQCGYPGCRPYAEAIAKGEAKINRCAPGGNSAIAELAHLLDVAPLPLDEAYGEETLPMVAWIREKDCIGCTICIQACPVDAIIGTAKMMHTVITEECTGCDLCVEPCPVDCIEMRPIKAETENWKWPMPGQTANN